MIFSNVFLKTMLLSLPFQLAKGLILELDRSKLTSGILATSIIVDQLYEQKEIEILLRLMKTAGSNVIGFYENTCPKWSFEFLEAIKGFIFSDPKYSQLLLTQTCYENLDEYVKEAQTEIRLDFDRGLLGAYSSLKDKDGAVSRGLLAEKLEILDPNSYLFSLDYIELFFNIDPDLDVHTLTNFLFPSMKRVVPESSNDNYFGDLYIDYARRIIHEDPSVVYLLLSVFFALTCSYPKMGPFRNTLNLLRELVAQINDDTKLSERSETNRLIYKSLVVSNERPTQYGDYQIIRNKIREIPLSDRSLLRYAHMLIMANQTSNADITCRYFLGTKNIERLSHSRGLLVYHRARGCLHQDEFIFNYRKWHTTFMEDPVKGSIFEVSDLLFGSIDLRPTIINSKNGPFAIREYIDLVVKSLNSEGRSLIEIIEAHNGNKKLKFDIELLEDENLFDILLCLIKLVVVNMIHFDYSISFEGSMTEKFLNSELNNENDEILEYLLLTENAILSS